MAMLVKLWLMLSGTILIALGIVISPLPGPIGAPVILFGVAVLLRSSIGLKRRFVRLRARHPKLLGPIRALLRPGAKVLALLWLQVLRLERFALPKPARGLLRMRRGMKSLCRGRNHGRHSSVTLSDAPRPHRCGLFARGVSSLPAAERIGR